VNAAPSRADKPDCLAKGPSAVRISGQFAFIMRYPVDEKRVCQKAAHWGT
jgi:hypothetical protein